MNLWLKEEYLYGLVFCVILKNGFFMIENYIDR